MISVSAPTSTTPGATVCATVSGASSAEIKVTGPAGQIGFEVTPERDGFKITFTASREGMILIGVKHGGEALTPTFVIVR